VSNWGPHVLQNDSSEGRDKPIFCHTNLFNTPPNPTFMFSFSCSSLLLSLSLQHRFLESQIVYNHCQKCYHGPNWILQYFHNLELHSKLVLVQASSAWRNLDRSLNIHFSLSNIKNFQTTAFSLHAMQKLPASSKLLWLETTVWTNLSTKVPHSPPPFYFCLQMLMSKGKGAIMNVNAKYIHTHQHSHAEKSAQQFPKLSCHIYCKYFTSQSHCWQDITVVTIPMFSWQMKVKGK
jgi:hypothetical protein